MPIKICTVCKKNESRFDETLGYLPCEECKNRRLGIKTPESVEFTSEQIKEDRKIYSRDILQPFRDGVVSKEYLETYGTKGIQVDEEDVKKAVPTTDSYYG